MRQNSMKAWVGADMRVGNDEVAMELEALFLGRQGTGLRAAQAALRRRL